MKNKRYKETFAQSIFALMMSQVVIKVLGLFYKLYLTNRNGFGDEGNAIANGGFQIYALILSVVAIGIPTAISKLIAETMGKGNYRGAYKIFKISFIIFSALGMLGSFGLYFFSNYFAEQYLHISETRLSIIALAPSVFLTSMISVLKGFFSGREEIKKTANAQSFDQLAKTISTFAMIELSIWILKNTNTELMAALSNFSTTIGNFVEFTYLYRMYLKTLPDIKREIQLSTNNENIRIVNIIKEVLIVAIPMSLTAIISTVSKNIDSTTIVNDLTSLIGYEEAKRQYGILSGKIDTLINFPLSFNMAIVTSLLPAIASNNGNIKKQEQRINQSFMLAMTIAFPITFYFIGFSDEILKFLFPNAPNGGDILVISSVAIIFITIEQITNIVLNGVGKNSIPVKAILLGVIFKAVLNRTLVHRIELSYGGTRGAAIATLVCHLVASIVSYILLIKHTKIKIKLENFIKPLIMSGAMVLVAKIVYLTLEARVGFKTNFIITTATAMFFLGVLLISLGNVRIKRFFNH